MPCAGGEVDPRHARAAGAEELKHLHGGRTWLAACVLCGLLLEEPDWAARLRPCCMRSTNCCVLGALNKPLLVPAPISSSRGLGLGDCMLALVKPSCSYWPSKAPDELEL